MNLLRTLMILYFTPDFILISFTISRILDIVIETEAYECLLLFILQFITLMFYLEIFELNFLNDTLIKKFIVLNICRHNNN